MRMEIRGQLPLILTQRKNYVVASCPVLDVHSQGRTVEEAKQNLAEAIGLFILTAFENGTLQEVLADCGIRQNQLSLTDTDSEEVIDISVPLIQQNNDAPLCLA